MADFLTGHTFGSTEQVTNTKLHNMVNNASISNVQVKEFAPMLGTFATNASLINISNCAAFNIYYSTYASIATLISAAIGQKITLIAQQASTPTILDAGVFLLNGAWTPAKSGDNLTLIWNGTNFIEIGRVGV